MISLPPITEPGFHYRDKDHSYWLDGVLLPSVTQIFRDVGLANYSGIDPHVLKNAADRGTYVHQACEAMDNRELDWDGIDRECLPYIEAYRDWKDESGFVPYRWGKPMYAVVDGFTYGMSFDVDGIIDGIPTLVDLKCTSKMSVTVGPQIAGYELGIGEPRRRLGLHLKPDGKFKPYPYDDPEDYQLFTVALYTVLGPSYIRLWHEARKPKKRESRNLCGKDS